MKSPIKEKRYILNIILCIIAAGLIVFYTICGDSCVYLQGKLFGLDLQYSGLTYIAVLVVLNIVKRDTLIIVALVAGVGVEIFLVGFFFVFACFQGSAVPVYS